MFRIPLDSWIDGSILIALACCGSGIFCGGMMQRSRKPESWNLEFHLNLLLRSHLRVVGVPLFPQDTPNRDIVGLFDQADMAIVSHGTESDPVFNYGNAKALELFEMQPDAFTCLPSRLSAETLEQSERQRLLERVESQGFVTDYSGVRISSTGKRFMIERATVWNVMDADGIYHGQAACFSQWHSLHD